MQYSAFIPQFVDALGVKTAYYTAGEPDERPIVLLHGMTSSADVYRELMHELSDQFWLIAPDIPGFGASEVTKPYTLAHLVEWLAAFTDELELPPFTLVGHSFGGALATSYTLSDPHDVTRLQLIAPALLSVNQFPDLVKKAGIWLGLVDLGTAVSQTPAIAKRQLRPPFYDPEQLTESMLERHVQEYIQSRSSADVLKALAFQEFAPYLDKIQQPVCLIWGEEDQVLPVAEADELKSLRPTWEVIKLAECGHVPMWEQPAAVQSISRQWFSGEIPMPPPDYQVISVFGSSLPQPGDEDFEMACRVGQLLAEAGYAVATGGYVGTMTAVSQGASSAGGHVIGVTSDQIEQFRPIAPNEWIVEEKRFTNLRDRLLYLVRENEGMIVLPGGIGTLSEMSLAWSFLQTGEIEPRPLVLLGEMWPQTIQPFLEAGYVKPQYAEMLFFAAAPETAVNFIIQHVKTTP